MGLDLKSEKSKGKFYTFGNSGKMENQATVLPGNNYSALPLRVLLCRTLALWAAELILINEPSHEFQAHLWL